MAPNELIDLDAERAARRVEKKMTVPELLDEFEWLLDGGVHPLLAAQQLGVKYMTLNTYAKRYGAPSCSTASTSAPGIGTCSTADPAGGYAA